MLRCFDRSHGLGHVNAWQCCFVAYGKADIILTTAVWEIHSVAYGKADIMLTAPISDDRAPGTGSNFNYRAGFQSNLVTFNLL